MAKQQSFADKSKAKAKVGFVTVKYIKTVKAEGGSYKFQEKFVKLSDVSKVTELN
ncbi:hypothetical protein ASZ90_003811 [hydrocarbon metagenome]|uniref:DUF4295 domain-containing protein n=1 Tax=hydrocarbon metagenome TaxID=938273 RepID=A0A0W8FZV1_9ZZZZ